MILISPCYFNIWMVASYIKTTKSSAKFTNVLEEPLKTHEWLFLLHDHYYFLDSQCAAGDVVPRMREIRIPGSEFKFFNSLSLNYRITWGNHYKKLRIVATFWKLRDFSTYYFSYLRTINTRGTLCFCFVTAFSTELKKRCMK